MKRVVRITTQGKVKDVHPTSLGTDSDLDQVDTTVACIQVLIPVGLAAVDEERSKELTRLVWRKHSRTEGLPGVVRWCRQCGSVYVADQKIPMTYQPAGVARSRAADHAGAALCPRWRQGAPEGDRDRFRRPCLRQALRIELGTQVRLTAQQVA